MAQIPGSVPLTGKVAPTDTTDTFATHVDIYGEGGYMTVADVTERDAITTERRKQGMAVFVNSTNEMYILQDGVTNADWVLFSGGGGDLQSVMNSGSSATGLTTQVDIETNDLMFLQSGQAITLTTDDFNMSVAGSSNPIVGDELQVTNVFTLSGNTYGKLKWRPGVQQLKVNLSEALIQTLHTTGYDLILSGGIPSNKFLNVLNIMCYVDTQFTNSESLKFYIDGCTAGGGFSNPIYQADLITGEPVGTGTYAGRSNSAQSFGSNCQALTTRLTGASGVPVNSGGVGGIDVYVTYQFIDK